MAIGSQKWTLCAHVFLKRSGLKGAWTLFSMLLSKCKCFVVVPIKTFSGKDGSLHRFYSPYLTSVNRSGSFWNSIGRSEAVRRLNVRRRSTLAVERTSTSKRSCPHREVRLADAVVGFLLHCPVSREFLHLKLFPLLLKTAGGKSWMNGQAHWTQWPVQSCKTQISVYEWHLMTSLFR